MFSVQNVNGREYLCLCFHHWSFITIVKCNRAHNINFVTTKMLRSFRYGLWAKLPFKTQNVLFINNNKNNTMGCAQVAKFVLNMELKRGDVLGEGRLPKLQFGYYCRFHWAVNFSYKICKGRVIAFRFLTLMPNGWGWNTGHSSNLNNNNNNNLKTLPKGYKTKFLDQLYWNTFRINPFGFIHFMWQKMHDMMTFLHAWTYWQWLGFIIVLMY